MSRFFRQVARHRGRSMLKNARRMMELPDSMAQHPPHVGKRKVHMNEAAKDPQAGLGWTGPPTPWRDHKGKPVTPGSRP